MCFILKQTYEPWETSQNPTANQIFFNPIKDGNSDSHQPRSAVASSHIIQSRDLKKWKEKPPPHLFSDEPMFEQALISITFLLKKKNLTISGVFMVCGILQLCLQWVLSSFKNRQCIMQWVTVMSEQITACLSLTYFIIVMPALYARDYTSPSFVF